ncbi:MAG TPA: hypothetical protein VFN73_05640 [Propionibacteriaceae bacterium]|nr:hypothetical protein [Propionibacteriaceae bacterium]
MPDTLVPGAGDLARRLAVAKPPNLRAAVRRRGAVTAVADGVAHVVGLDRVGSEDLVAFDSGALGMAYELETGHTSVVLLDADVPVRAGDGVHPVGRGPSVATGPGLLGRVVDPLGRPLDGGPRPLTAESLPLFRDAPTLSQRAPVTRPLLTGVMVIDAAIPIGRGQRQLILGDRNVAHHNRRCSGV